MIRKLIFGVTIAWIATFIYQFQLHKKHEHCVDVVINKLFKNETLDARQKRELGITVSYFCDEESNDIYEVLTKL